MDELSFRHRTISDYDISVYALLYERATGVS
jgi:hypothetical protein